MAPPLPFVQAQGLAVVSADQLNTFVQGVLNFAQLRGFSALANMLVQVEGGASPGDGLGGMFYYNSASAASDNGATVIVPTGNVEGAWIKIGTVYSYQTPATGFSIQIPSGASSLILNPSGALASGTIIMPATPIDGQTISIASTQVITALTLSAPAGQTIYGAITTLAANGRASYQYVLSVASWFRID